MISPGAFASSPFDRSTFLISLLMSSFFVGQEEIVFSAAADLRGRAEGTTQAPFQRQQDGLRLQPPLRSVSYRQPEGGALLVSVITPLADDYEIYDKAKRFWRVLPTMVTS